MIILAIDPAMRGPAGAAVIDPDAPAVLWLDVLTYRRGEPTEARYASFSAWLAALWADWGGRVELAACEDNYLRDNVATVKALAQCVGIARAHAYRRGCPFRLINATHTHPTLATIPAGLLTRAPGYGDIAEREREHAYCAVAVGWRAYHEEQEARLRQRGAA